MRRREANRRDNLVDLPPRKLAAFAGLGTLSHLDLQLVGVGEIERRDAETARSDLLDRRAPRGAVGRRHESPRILAAFARVALAAELVHRDGERLVRFL